MVVGQACGTIVFAYSRVKYFSAVTHERGLGFLRLSLRASVCRESERYFHLGKKSQESSNVRVTTK